MVNGGHMATLLLDGRVLVAGGGVGTSAELYDPASETWSATGSMVEVRGGATITLLRDGRVLVAGGQSFGVGTAELYDPTTRTWTATASLSAGRIDHTAVLLPDGTVLVAGGYTYDTTGNNATALASAELYDPSTETWTETGSMAAARTGQTATLLSGGTVLVAGGQNVRDNAAIGDYLASAELYDPTSRTWAATAAMAEGRLYHTATLLLNGHVLVAGGGIATASAELYEPGSGS
jgi:N-acetylneuraminic acid mutarotase